MSNLHSLDAVTQSVNKAKGLPNEYYIDEDVFANEQKAILFRSWTGIGFGKDVPEAGDARPLEFLGIPLLMIRDHDGQVGVFQNTCRHRGMILVEEPKKLRNTVRCPYHSWCYSLKGELRATPHVGGPGYNTHDDIKPLELGLIRIRSYMWHDVVFINLSSDAPEFEHTHAGLLDRWKEFEQPMYHGGASSSFALNVKTNWKLAVENYCESYHLPWIHPGLNSYSRLEDHYDIQQSGKFSGQGTHVYRQLKGKGEDEQTFTDFHGLSEKWDTAAEYIAVYPNVLMGVHRDHFYAIVLEPVKVDQTIEHIELYYASDAEEHAELASMRDANAALWKSVFVEDIGVVEGMQRGRHGVFFDGGKFSPAMDKPTHNFHHWVATKMANADAHDSGQSA